MTRREAFEVYLRENTKEGTGTLKSYLKGLDLVSDMIQQHPAGFEDCEDVWKVGSVDRLQALLQKLRKEQKLKEQSAWFLEGQRSYLEGGFSAAALGHYRQFLVEYRHEQHLLDLFRSHHGDPDELAKLLNQELELPDYLEQEMEGFESVREVKTRHGQDFFRKMILESYGNRCCITGMDIPQLNIASHIIRWADNKDTRMDPRNGLCLSGTFDRAFDRNLLTLDEDYRVVISKEIKEHYPQQVVKETFQKREGQVIHLPGKSERWPLQEYLEVHREKVAV
jgi:putative restriction endonuclease